MSGGNRVKRFDLDMKRGSRSECFDLDLSMKTKIRALLKQTLFQTVSSRAGFSSKFTGIRNERCDLDTEIDMPIQTKIRAFLKQTLSDHVLASGILQQIHFIKSKNR